MGNRRIRQRTLRYVMAIALGGSVFQLGSCDPTVRSTLIGGLQTTTNALADTLIQVFFTSLAADDGAAGGGSGGLTTT